MKLGNHKTFGISVYPSNASLKEMKDYIQLASKYNFKRLFLSLLELDSVDKLDLFKEIMSFAKNLGYHITVDLSPKVYKVFNLQRTETKFFSEIGADAIRLNLMYSDKEVADITYNEDNLDIEINISTGSKMIENILHYKPNCQHLLGCHNFYPLIYTGLTEEFFDKHTKVYKENYIRTAAFVNTLSGQVGPWPHKGELMTLEKHRDIDLLGQVKELCYKPFVDDILIGNCYATEEELKQISELDYKYVELRIKFEENVTDVEKEIVMDFDHVRRGDTSEIMLRSTLSRHAYSEHTIKPRITEEFVSFGDVIVCNENFNHYKGELQIANEDLPIANGHNIVARVIDDDLELINYIKPWTKFKFVEVK